MLHHRLCSAVRPEFRLLILLGIGAAFILSGCQSKNDGVSVRGTVSYRGQAFSNASITFYPATGRPVYSSISDGNYAVELLPGQYKVAISLGVNLPENWKEGDPIPSREFVLPDKYSDPRDTPLVAAVNEDQIAPINFDLQ
jgi:hypothetical protein